MTRRTVPSSSSCSACTRTILPAICLSKVVGSTSTCRQSPFEDSDHSPRPRQSDDTADRRHPASGAREQRRPRPDQGGDRQPDVLGAVSAAAGSARRQSHPTRLVPVLRPAAPQGPRKRIVQSWDIAMMTGDANDYSVCTTWWIIKSGLLPRSTCSARRLQYPDLRRKVASLAAQARCRNHPDRGCRTRHGSCCRISGAILPQGCRVPSVGSRRAARWIAWWRSPPRSKLDTSICQRRPTGSTLSCLNCWHFRHGRHDDQVDSVSQFLKWSSSQRQSVFDLTMIGMGAKVFVGGIQIYPPESESSE